MSLLFRVVHRRVTAVSDGVDVRTVVQEHADDIEIAATEGLDSVDPVTRELVRMRNAKYQHCNL